MNVREGMRRLGILLGACGGIVGASLTYGDARITWEQHMAHRKFEAFMSAPTVQKVAKATRDYISKGVNLLETSGDLTYEANGTIWKTVPGDSSQPERGKARQPHDKFGGIPVEEVPPSGRKPKFSGTPVFDNPNPMFDGTPVDDDQRAPPRSKPLTIAKSEPLIPSFEEFKADRAAGQKPDPWEKYAVSKGVNPWAGGDVLVNLDGIKQVTVDEVGAISSIELSTGESVQRVDRPPMKAYLIPLLYPVLGFLLPWGGIRLLTWVGSGFVEPRR